ncbi:carboxynorspermidine dehydrogenase [Sporolactobacillus inulinus]|uniref:Carboxynorspermidine dehydrogenase n=1 Tax=Sporolactobacillus inulinus TaxID=2078 RepID=A0A4Y1ZE48_9BACL|nr:carboxynorspermidine dehydrogenase [Sporolactobacillus inulinus]
MTANGSYFENGKFIETKPMAIKRVYDFPQIGPKDIYLLHHEEMESLAQNIKRH